MRGFVPTPDIIVDGMIDRLFAETTPTENSTILDPGCGEGAFIDGLIRWSQRVKTAVPKITGIESHPERAKLARAKYKQYPTVEIKCRDFLKESRAKYDYIIGNPPYVSILHILEHEREEYRQRYESARGRFDLYMLFFEQSLRNLQPDGRLVFITPEKFLYVNTGKALRDLLSRHRIVELSLIAEDAFKGLVTYPTVTVIDRKEPLGKTLFVDRSNSKHKVSLPKNGSSFLSVLGDNAKIRGTRKLEDLCVRISCGIATGADAVYVRERTELPRSLLPFAYPTISGRQLVNDGFAGNSEVMLIPYDKRGRLTPESKLGNLADELLASKDALLKRVCTKTKPWYAFHDNVPFDEMLLPKILCKDISKTPKFWADADGSLVPRHSVYYIVPKDSNSLEAILEYLNSPDAQSWLKANCQRAANGFLRVQSSVLKRLPIPDSLAGGKHRRKCPETAVG